MTVVLAHPGAVARMLSNKTTPTGSFRAFISWMVAMIFSTCWPSSLGPRLTGAVMTRNGGVVSKPLREKRRVGFKAIEETRLAFASDVEHATFQGCSPNHSSPSSSARARLIARRVFPAVEGPKIRVR